MLLQQEILILLIIRILYGLIPVPTEEDILRPLHLANNNNLTADIPFRFGKDSNGKYGYIVNEGGADTVIPFKKAPTKIGGTYTGDQNINVASYFPTSVDDFIIELVGMNGASLHHGSIYMDQCAVDNVTISKTLSSGVLTIKASYRLRGRQYAPETSVYSSRASLLYNVYFIK